MAWQWETPQGMLRIDVCGDVFVVENLDTGERAAFPIRFLQRHLHIGRWIEIEEDAPEMERDEEGELI